MLDHCFVSALWSDKHVETRCTAWQNACDAVRRWRNGFRVTPHVVLVFGLDNLSFLKHIGADEFCTLRLIDADGVVNYNWDDSERNSMRRGRINWGLSYWGQKLHAIEYALRRIAPHVMWLDLDCKLKRPVPDDFWDTLKAGPSFRSSAISYLVPLCTWRPDVEERRFAPHGAVYYCRDVEIISTAREIHRVSLCPSDEAAVALSVEQHLMNGVWPGVKEYDRRFGLPWYHTKRIVTPATEPLLFEE